jgi:ketosteroid isomerase-like protein
VHANQQLLTSFYDAFRNGDGNAMAACYHPEATFSDPVFPGLDSGEVQAMWRMFCDGAAKPRIEFEGVEADDERGRARWDAHYLFGATGRKVHNRIDASFRFRDGLILEHTDSFSLWRWTRMALGTSGLLVGWTPAVRKKVRTMARRRLDEFIDKQAP